MPIDYKKLENDFDCACKNVVTSLSEQYKNDFAAAGPAKLLTFFDLIQQEFESARTKFVAEHDIGTDAEAMKSVNSITKSYARKCVEEYSRIDFVK